MAKDGVCISTALYRVPQLQRDFLSCCLSAPAACSVVVGVLEQPVSHPPRSLTPLQTSISGGVGPMMPTAVLVFLTMKPKTDLQRLCSRFLARKTQFFFLADPGHLSHQIPRKIVVRCRPPPPPPSTRTSSHTRRNALIVFCIAFAVSWRSLHSAGLSLCLAFHTLRRR